MSAHVIKGLASPDSVTAFVASPSAGTDVPIPVRWGDATTGVDTGLRVVCFYAANTSAPRLDRPQWPRITAVGFELPGSPSGFTLVEPLDREWELVEGAEASLPDHDEVTLDFALVARESRARWTRRHPREPRGIPPGQPAERGRGTTRFCVTGPFPDRLPNTSTPDPEDTVATNIEKLIDGVVVGFHGVEGNRRGTDAGVWFPNPPGNLPRQIPLYPE